MESQMLRATRNFAPESPRANARFGAPIAPAMLPTPTAERSPGASGRDPQEIRASLGESPIRQGFPIDPRDDKNVVTVRESTLMSDRGMINGN
jgi:hypothetical protein